MKKVWIVMCNDAIDSVYSKHEYAREYTKTRENEDIANDVWHSWRIYEQEVREHA